MSRTAEDLQRMAREDTDIGLNYAHYKPMENFIKERGVQNRNRNRHSLRRFSESFTFNL